MDQKLSYEHLITSKLETIPVPDMADAIWSRIEQQLDLDMPTGDGGSTPGTPPGGIIISGISLLFIIAFISFLLFNENKQLKPVPTTQPVPSVTIPAPENKPPGQPAQVEQVTDNTGKKEVILPAEKIQDPGMIPAPVDTPQVVTQSTPPAITPIAPLKIDSTVKEGRKKGVTGITDSDYRIVPKKDSSN